MVLIAVPGFKLMSGDAIGQTERTKSEELNATSLPNKVKITINNVILQADVALSSEEQTKGLSIKDSLKSNEGMIFPVRVSTDSKLLDERYEISHRYPLAGR